MAIIRYTKDATIRYAYLNIFPDQFKTEKEKQDESWIKKIFNMSMAFINSIMDIAFLKLFVFTFNFFKINGITFSSTSKIPFSI